ncbi:E3 ubiquitin-protein ligase TRIM9-like [Haliotis rubra]|uniref:E3 ubiquitin-protein ligase TRIM9-like n=1 Tax=Haliotis rubra TaxID=36100 RepID=UPI001EE60A39|nr:E3 ubiquitin-protein ligase TRIM9-like [Haliotis rubra]
MATAMKLPRCGVCGISFTYGGPDPHLLPCLHSVCQECLNLGTSDTLTCDICQETFDKEQTDFPTDVVAIKDIFLQTAEYDGSAVLCTNKGDGNQAMSWCGECEALLCEHCQAGHEDMKITRSHKVVPLENLKSSDGVPIPKTAYCTEHVDHPLQLYDETCEQRICFKCRENHGVCKVNDITEAYQHLKETVLDEEKKGLAKKIETISAIREQIHTVVKLSETKEEEGKDFLKHTFSDLRNTLNQREEELLLELGQSFKAVYDVNNSRLYELGKKEAKCDTALGYCQKFADMSSVDAILNAKKTVLSRTSGCIAAKVSQVSERESSITLSRKDLTDLKQSISSFGEYYVPMDPQAESQHHPEGSTINAMKGNIKRLEADNVSLLEALKSRGQQIKELTSTMESLVRVSDVAVHFLRMPDVSFPVPLLCTPLKYDKDKVNLDKVHINTEGDLVDRKSFTRVAGKGRLKKYWGTCSTAPLSQDGCPQYWEVENRVSLDKLLSENLLILEVGVCRVEQRDVSHSIGGRPHSYCMIVSCCPIHGGICRKIGKEGKRVLCLPDTLPNTAPHTLHYGVVYDDARKKIVFIDVKEKKVMSTLDNVDCSEPLWPMFGVYNSGDVTVSMKLVVGSDISMTEEKKAMIVKALS